MKLPTITEQDFQSDVVKLARLTGHLVYHTYDSRRSEPGFPDLCIVKAGMHRPLFVELKTGHGRLSDAQKKWGEVLTRTPGADYRVWRPDDWLEIENTLCRRE